MRFILGIVFLACCCGGHITGCSNQIIQSDSYTHSESSINSETSSVQEKQIPERLDATISSPRNILNKLKSIKTVAAQSEFETSDDFKKRLELSQSGNWADKTYYVAANIDGSFGKITYDPYSKKFKYEIQSYPARILEGPRSLETLPLNILLSFNYKDAGSYTGVNAFGVSKRVSKSNFTTISLNIVNKRSLAIYNSETINSIPTKFWGYSKIIDPSLAERIKPNLAIIIEFVPALGLNDDIKYATFTKDIDHTDPTLSKPDDDTTIKTIIFGKCKNIYLVDKKTMVVYGMIQI